MTVLAIILEIVLAAAFLGASLSKLSGAKMQVDSFNKLGLPQWFRVVTGLMQLIGVAGLIVGFWETSWAAWAGIWFGFMMLCAVAAHIRAKDNFSQAIPALVLMLIGVAVLLLRASELGQFPG